MVAHVRDAHTLSQRIKYGWREFKTARAGHRFQDRYRRRRKYGHSLLSKALSLTAGLILFVLGLILLPAPGPGFLVVFIGAGMIAEESYVSARALDWIEVRLRRVFGRGLRAWTHASTPAKALAVLVAFAALAVLAIIAWNVFLPS